MSTPEGNRRPVRETDITESDWSFEQARANGLNVHESRAIWHLHRYHCWSVVEIAELFGLAPTFVHQALLAIERETT